MPHDAAAPPPNRPEALSTDWLRRNLADVLQRVSTGGERFLLYRRNTPVAGLVPPHEALALYEVAVTHLRVKDLAERLNRLETRGFDETLEAALQDLRTAPGPDGAVRRLEPKRSARQAGTAEDDDDDLSDVEVDWELKWEDMNPEQRVREIKRREIEARMRALRSTHVRPDPH